MRILLVIVLFIPNTQLSCGKEEFSIRTLPTAYDVKEAETTTTTKEEKDIVAQKIMDLETGYLIHSEKGDTYYYGDPDKRDLIKGTKE